MQKARRFSLGDLVQDTRDIKNGFNTFGIILEERQCINYPRKKEYFIFWNYGHGHYGWWLEKFLVKVENGE
tara:strand:+ start:284 stop:496 length:213 start_codon:yes stop_codon:yes gene_type:complete